MVNYLEILRLGSDPESTQRSIAAAVHSSRDTIREVLTTAKEAGVEWPLDDSVTNEMLKSILFPEKFAAASLYVQPDYPRIHAELALPGVNMTLLWMSYSKRCESEGTSRICTRCSARSTGSGRASRKRRCVSFISPATQCR